MKKLAVFITLICVFMNIGVFAVSDNNGLTEAILAVKSIIEIPSEYDDFSYSSREYGENVEWSLSWNDAARAIGRINASVSDETIMSLSIYNYNREFREISNISVHEAKTTATAFIEKIMPALAPQMKIENEDQIVINSDNDSFAIFFRKYVNEIPVMDDFCTVRVDKMTGEVTYFERSFFDTEVEYETEDNIISLDEAEKIFADSDKLELQYNSYYDYSTEKLSVFPVYAIKNYDYEAISAKTGEFTKLSAENEEMFGRVYAQNSKATLENASDSAGGLSAVEISAVKNVESLISKDEAAAAVLKFVPWAEKDAQISEAGLYRNYMEKTQFIWNIYFTLNGEYYMQGRVDAQNGQLLGFSFMNGKTEGNKKISEDAAKKEVEEFIKQVSPERFSQTEFTGEKYPVNPIIKDSNTEEYADLYSFTYTRVVNGIKYYNDCIYASYNNNTGRIESFDVSWNRNAQFPSLENIVDKDAAMENASEFNSFKLMYKNGKLIYTFADSTATIFDANTGEALKYNGKPYVRQKLPAYNDIYGHWAENIILKLLENGIYKNSSQFMPDAFITQSEFFKMTFSDYYFENENELYEYLIRDGIILENEKAPQSNITRKEAARIFAFRLGYKTIAEKSEIFVCPFEDVSDDKYKGSIAICKAMGIISGDGSGAFNPDSNITNAETASLIYKFKINK